MMLVTWLIELYLNQLGDLRDSNEKDGEQYKVLQEDFRKFLHQGRVQVCLCDDCCVSKWSTERIHLYIETLSWEYIILKTVFEMTVFMNIGSSSYSMTAFISDIKWQLCECHSLLLYLTPLTHPLRPLTLRTPIPSEDISDTFAYDYMTLQGWLVMNVIKL